MTRKDYTLMADMMVEAIKTLKRTYDNFNQDRFVDYISKKVKEG